MNETELTQRLAQNLHAVRERIAQAAARGGRSGASVRLVAVTKYVSPEVIRALRAAGAIDLGENRVQQLTARASELGADFSPLAGEPPSAAPRWHMIGHLQRNKVRALLGASRVLHSLDSLRLAQALSDEAGKQGIEVEAFVELNLGHEQAKSGMGVDVAEREAAQIAALPGLKVVGLMGMAPLDTADDSERARPHFARLRTLHADWRRRGLLPESACELSMGMSGDFEVAVEEGATWVRLGSVLFDGVPADG